MSDSEWVTLEEAAAQLRKTPRQINEYCKEGKLEFHKMAGKTYISDESIGVFLELYEGRRRVPGGADEEQVDEVNKQEAPKAVQQEEQEAPKAVQQEEQEAPKAVQQEEQESTAQVVDDGSKTEHIKPEPPTDAESLPEKSPQADAEDIKKYMPPAKMEEEEPSAIKKAMPPANKPESDTNIRRYGEEPETAEASGTSSVESRWKPKVTPADLSSKPEASDPPAPVGSPATPEQSRAPESAPPGEPPSVSEPPPVQPITPGTPSSSDIRPNSPDQSVTPKPVPDIPKATDIRPMDPVSTTQEVDGIVNDSTHSSELLKSIRDRIAAHEAAEQAFCKEMRDLVDTLEAAFREEESKAGQLTKEISSLISRYSQQGE